MAPVGVPLRLTVNVVAFEGCQYSRMHLDHGSMSFHHINGHTSRLRAKEA